MVKKQNDIIMKLSNGYNVSKEFAKKYIEGKLSKKVYLEYIDKTLTFTIDFGDDHTYMVYCEETGWCIEDNNWSAIKDLQKNPWWDIGWDSEHNCPVDDLIFDDDLLKYVKQKN